MQPASPPSATRALDRYEHRIGELRAALAALEASSARYSSLRAVTFLGSLAAFAAVAFADVPPAVTIVGATLAAAFVALVVAHAVLVTRSTAVERRVKLLDRAKRRAGGDFAGFPETGERFRVADHPYAGDLDVFGKASLFQLLDATQTGEGEAVLASWLSSPASAAEVASRQEAARELAALLAFREELAFEGAEAGVRGHGAEKLVAWAEQAPALDGAAKDGAPRVGLVGAARVLVPLTALLFVLSESALQPYGLLRHVWVLPFLGQLAIWTALRSAIEPSLAAAGSREAPFGRYRKVLERIEGQAFTSPRLAKLRATLTGGPGEAAASVEMERLQRIVGYADLRHSGLIHFLANLSVLYDVWCAVALDRWRKRTGARVRVWLATLGEVEALVSLATFAYENPDYAWPEIADGAPRFDATELGHPLIGRARRVANDVALGGDVPALVVTGSNMSGKSTMLRSIGVSTVLALAGAPVAAKRLAMTPLAVRTSMRMEDSLEQGVSHFYAELKRLKMVVDSANQGDRVLFLLDEVLHGTNSRERRIGAKAVVKHLLERGAVGAVSSHDLGLSALEEESAGRVRNVHFEEHVEGDAMSFDYKLKQGVVTTANALRLMRLVGIAVEMPDD